MPAYWKDFGLSSISARKSVPVRIRGLHRESGQWCLDSGGHATEGFERVSSREDQPEENSLVPLFFGEKNSSGVFGLLAFYGTGCVMESTRGNVGSNPVPSPTKGEVMATLKLIKPVGTLKSVEGQKLISSVRSIWDSTLYLEFESEIVAIGWDDDDESFCLLKAKDIQPSYYDIEKMVEDGFVTAKSWEQYKEDQKRDEENWLQAARDKEKAQYERLKKKFEKKRRMKNAESIR